MHCAPVAVSDGLIYLANTLHLAGLVVGKDHDAQIEVIKELAEDFKTDPSIGGTNPDKILTGLRVYAARKGYELRRLELMTWRRVGSSNKRFKLGDKPDMAWMRKAAQRRDTVVIFNFGWYYEDGDGYARKGGHWVAVVGAGNDDENVGEDEDEDDDVPSEFLVHNPLLAPEKQAENTAVELTLLDDDFAVTNDDGEANMQGYYEADGPGLPHGKKVKPILDGVIVFTLKRE
jgi:hypothetical protein